MHHVTMDILDYRCNVKHNDQQLTIVMARALDNVREIVLVICTSCTAFEKLRPNFIGYV